jgi:protein ImuB
VDGNPWEPVAAWAGPWPSDERWWSRSRRRGARLQVVSPAVAEEMAGEVARLLVAERGRWWVEATYG